MNPTLVELIKSLRNGLIFNPLTELQKRATQFGEGVGEDLQAKRAQAGYAAAHPQSQRAQLQRMTNAATLALQTWKPIEGVSPEHLAAVDKTAPERIIAPAMANKKSGLFNTGVAHFEAVPNLIRALVSQGKSGDADVHGWFTSHGRVVSQEKAYQIKKAELSPKRQAQIEAGAKDVGVKPRLHSGDFLADSLPALGGAIGRIGPKGIWGKWNPPEKQGVETPPLSGKFLAGGKMAGYIIPENADVATKLGLRNRVSADIEEAHPSKPGLTLLDSLANMRGKPHALSPEDKHLAEFRSIDSAWNVSYKALQAIQKQLEEHPEKHRQSLMDALRGGPQPPKGDPSLAGAYDKPDYIPTVEAIKYAKQLPHQFKQALTDSKNFAAQFYGTNDLKRDVWSRAKDIELAARHVIKQANAGVFVPPHATDAEAAKIIGHGNQVLRGLHKYEPSILKALQAAMDAARFLHLKD